MKKSAFVFLVLILGSLPISAAHEDSGPKPLVPDSIPRCTFDWLTDSCKMFEQSPQARFFLPDATSIPNPVPELLKKMGTPDAEKYARDVKIKNEMAQLANQWMSALQANAGEVLQVLKADDPENVKIAKDVKDYLAQASAAVALILTDKATDPTVIARWPLDKPKKVKQVKTTEVRDALRAALSPEAIEKIIKLGMAAKEIIDTMNSQLKSLGGEAYQPPPEFTQARRARVAELFKIAQDAVIKLIRNGKTELTPAQMSAIRRVETISLGDPDSPNAKDNPQCAEPNAFYVPETHSFTLCGGLEWQPDYSVLFVIAHELTHSFDPCQSQFDLFHVDKKEVAKLFNDDEPIEEVQKDLARVGLAGKLNAFSQTPGNSEYMEGRLPIDFSQDAIDYMKNKEILKVEAPATSADDFVLKEVSRCLQKEGFEAQDSQAAQQKAERTATYRKQHFGADYEKEVETIKKVLGVYPECEIGGHSEMSESLADWVGTQVLGSYLKDNLKGRTLQTPTEKLSIAYMATWGCAEIAAFKLRNNTRLGGLLGWAQTDYTNSFEPHPASRMRVENILLKNSDIDTALGCKPVSDGCPIEGKK